MSKHAARGIDGRLELGLGGDPRGFAEFVALRDELGKLDHPARPDVDWFRVERGCLALLQSNGAELQTLAALALARAQLYGPAPLLESIELLNTLMENPAIGFWPPLAEARAETLAWLCGHLHRWFRGRSPGREEVPLLIELEAALARLESLQPGPAHSASQRALRQAIAGRARGLEALGGAASAVVAQWPGAVGAPTAVSLAVALPAPITLVFTPAQSPARSARARHYLGWVSVFALALVAGLGGAWWYAAIPEPAPVGRLLRLDDLFDAGSVQISPKALPTLVSALATIKAQASALVMIGGHSDASGTAHMNLELSHARATAVRDWLHQVGGLAAGCLAVRGHADNQPLASNETAAGRAINRRVDIELVPQTAPCG